MLAMKLMAAVTLAMMVVPSTAAPLDGERWKKRIVLIFSTTGNETAREQARLLTSDQAALSERDMLIVEVAGNRARFIFGDSASRLDAGSLRKAHRIDPETPFAVVLLGKDGGEKLRRAGIVTKDDLFAIIDAMPMRLNEANKT